MKWTGFLVMCLNLVTSVAAQPAAASTTRDAASLGTLGEVAPRHMVGK